MLEFATLLASNPIMLRSLALSFALCAGLAAAVNVAAEPDPVAVSLVKDLDARPGTRGSAPGRFRTIGGRVYFSAMAARTGAEAYSTDAAGNLRLLADIAPGPASSSPEPIGVAGGRLIVSANDGMTGRQLWSLPLDGVGMPTRLTSLSNLWEGGTAPEFVNLTIGDRVLLTLPGQDYRLLSSDGTPQGTFERTPQTGFPLRSVTRGCALDGVAVVSGHNDSGHYLVRTNGVPGSDSVIATLPQPASVVDVARLSGHCYFLLSTSTIGSPGWSLWRSDGTAAGSTEVTSVPALAAGLESLDDDLLVLETVSETRMRMRRLAGGNAPAGAVVELDAQLGLYPSISIHEGYLMFDAYAVGTSGWEKALYVSDGTAAGTRRLYPPVGESGDGMRWYRVPGAIVRESPIGPDLRIELASGAISPLDSEPFDYASAARLNGVLIGSGAESVDRELWITAAQPGTTQKLYEIWADTQHGVPPPWRVNTTAAIGDVLFFTEAYDPTASGGRTALWRTDGSEQGTSMLPSALHGGAAPRVVQQYGSTGVLFTADNGGLYSADSTLSSAALAVSDFAGGLLLPAGNGATAIYGCGAAADLCGLGPGGASSWLASGEFWGVVEVGQIGGVAVFVRSSRQELWRSDGTAPGTYRLLTNLARVGAPDRTGQAILGGRLYFVACTDLDACDLMATDGTLAGTAAVRPIPARGLHAAARVGNRLVLGVGDSSAQQLWVTDGSAAGTLLLHDGNVEQFASTGEYVHMYAFCASCKSHYLVTDGTSAGTRFVELPAALRHSRLFAAALGHNAVVFSCDNQRRGVELCLADASGASVVPLPEIFPGVESSQPRPLGRTASAVYFSADDGLHGREPWQLRLLPDGLFAGGFD